MLSESQSRVKQAFPKFQSWIFATHIHSKLKLNLDFFLKTWKEFILENAPFLPAFHYIEDLKLIFASMPDLSDVGPPAKGPGQLY